MAASTIKAIELSGITSSSKYASGALKSCMVNKLNRIETPVGVLIPQYRLGEFGERQKKHRSSIDFFENGQIKSISLDEQTPVVTPLGVINAELVTFYEDGNMNRVFPLNGQVDGYWSEANERERADLIPFDLTVGQFSAKVISIHYYPSGQLKTLTVWPGQKLSIQTPAGVIEARAGFSLYEDGSLRSVEPMLPTVFTTPIGEVKAFDPNIIGMHADLNSVQFSPEGTLTSLKTIHTGVKVVDAKGRETLVEPPTAESLIDPEQMRTVPMTVEFTSDSVRIEAEKEYVFALSKNKFSTFEMKEVLRETCVNCPGDETCCQNGGDGGGCSSCGK